MNKGTTSSSRLTCATTPNNAIHVTKVGDRFAALEPISQGVPRAVRIGRS
ncbi:MAG: hypothetical protein VB124_02740 [Burkholderia sp.]